MQHKIVAALLLALTASAALYFASQHTDSQDDYLQWKERYGHKWSVEEDTYRRLIYLKNVEIINKHNSDPSQTYKKGINQFTALTKEEFVSSYLNPMLKSNPSE